MHTINLQGSWTRREAAELPDLGDAGLRARFRAAFAGAQPFPHLVVGGLFDPAFLLRVAGEFDGGLTGGRAIANARERTHRSGRPSAFGPATQRYFDLMHRHAMVDFLQDITGLAPLIVDPMLMNGGLHESRDGGRFAIHRDFNRHRQTMLDNALVVITYLNADWQPEWGGQLELWCARRKRVVRSIAPELGRTVIMAHGAHSWHGHTVPIDTGGTTPRRSVATYYYTRRIGLRERLGYHSTVFALDGKGRFAPSDVVPAGAGASLRQRAGEAARQVVPPVFWNLGRHLAGKL
ncbi:hypothetical protein AQZ52_08990 [Novosphingobium fuchskuhlense]|uniref:Prolyl 4-hydroxylase alpha subunit Fe(2+) 2OG dioxygenase domain-containing protein n=1 Tax=Novosphingobium fuchskuhlense TaxID=1117702 RepID=A0A117UVN6_9SPHN|nr:2OG-Fe(II) oxygenase [Novosphingobium fuchskuhlense]KUR71726.1 hypothetical protein AQZ52_08990 [Novosphingobium fuchskuhlense]